MIGAARFLKEAREVAGGTARSEQVEVYIIDHRTGKVWTVRHKVGKTQPKERY